MRCHGSHLPFDSNKQKKDFATISEWYHSRSITNKVIVLVTEKFRYHFSFENKVALVEDDGDYYETIAAVVNC